jgi:hypothetical protein
MSERRVEVLTTWDPSAVTRVRVDPSWLALREPADAAARAGDLIDEIRRELPADRPVVIHDLACGTGAMLRWLAPQLPGPQHWIAHDVDADLLAVLDTAPGTLAADRSAVTLEVSRKDVTRLGCDELADATVITSSAVLDLMTAAELCSFVRTCASARCPVLLTLTVTGVVTLAPEHPLDEAVTGAFNAHQRRTCGGRTLLGPDATDMVARLFTELGREVVTRTSAWRLGPATPDLAREWLLGWLAAARVQDPGLAAELDAYAVQRLDEAASGRLRVVVQHRDVLVRRAAGRDGATSS